MWQDKLNSILPLLGHRNWILIVDKAFPLQSAPGMTFINTNEDLPAVLANVLKNIAVANHIKPIIYTDKELEYLTSPEADELRRNLYDVITKYASGGKINTILHDEVFSKLDAASKLFNVVVLKTEAFIAYSSVFIELDCGYWDEDSECDLRQRMK